MTSTKDPLFGPEPSVVESELLYGDISENEGCFVSSRTITEPVPEDESHWCFGERSSVEHERSALFKQTAFTFDEDSDDEDDDNDYDGHSSMLSNASLRQKTTTVGGYYFVNGKDNHESIPRRNADSLSAQPRSASHMALLKLRGGGRIDLKSMASTALHSEISKKLIVAAVVTLVFEGLIGHILEFLKIVMQTANDDTTYLNVIRAITAEKGIMGLWDGFCPWGIVQAVSKGAVFGLAHASALATLLPLAKKGKLPMALALTLAGGIGGGFQGYVLSPTLLLKTRVMTVRVSFERTVVLVTF